MFQLSLTLTPKRYKIIGVLEQVPQSRTKGMMPMFWSQVHWDSIARINHHVETKRGSKDELSRFSKEWKSSYT